MENLVELKKEELREIDRGCLGFILLFFVTDEAGAHMIASGFASQGANK